MRALYAAMWAKCEQRTRRLSMVRECQCAVCGVQCGCYWAGSARLGLIDSPSAIVFRKLVQSGFKEKQRC